MGEAKRRKELGLKPKGNNKYTRALAKLTAMLAKRKE